MGVVVRRAGRLGLALAGPFLVPILLVAVPLLVGFTPRWSSVWLALHWVGGALALGLGAAGTWELALRMNVPCARAAVLAGLASWAAVAAVVLCPLYVRCVLEVGPEAAPAALWRALDAGHTTLLAVVVAPATALAWALRAWVPGGLRPHEAARRAMACAGAPFLALLLSVAVFGVEGRALVVAKALAAVALPSLALNAPLTHLFLNALRSSGLPPAPWSEP